MALHLVTTNCLTNNYSPNITRLAIDMSTLNVIKDIFNENDYVKNSDGLVGKIQSKDDMQVIIKWNDGTSERVRLNMIDDYLSKTNKDEFISDESNKKVNLDEIIATKKIKDLENRLANKDVMAAKDAAATELANLAAKKGMIDDDDIDMEILRIISMSEDEFLKYQQTVLDYQADDSEVTSYREDANVDYSGLSESEIRAQQELAKLKQLGKVDLSNRSMSVNNSSSSRRLLNDIKLDNEYNIPQKEVSMEEALAEKFGDLFNVPLLSNQSANQRTILQNNFNNQLIYSNEVNPIDISSSPTQVEVELMPTSSNENNQVVNNDFLQNSSTKQQNQSDFLKVPFEGITKPLSLGTEELYNITSSNPLVDSLKQLDWSTPITKINNRKNSII